MTDANRPLLDVADRFELLVDAVKEYAIFMLDPNGIVASWNAGAERIKGYAAGEIIGRHFSVFYPDEDILDGKPVHELIAAAADGEYREEGWRIRKDGTPFWANVVITAITDSSGRLAGFAKVTRDETERRAAATIAEQARAAAEAANLAKDQFVSRMSHELRTPLNAILGFGQLLEADRLEHEQHESIKQIVAAGQHLLALINEVLDIAQMSTGEMQLTLEPVDVGVVLTAATELIRPSADSADVRLVVDPSALTGRTVAHPRRLKQVILNLLSNAVKYNHAGGEVRVDGVTTQGRHRLTVHDTGIGIDAADLGRLFQPFDRLQADATEVEGTGLGLALSRQLMSAMHGEIGVTSRVGLGSSFWLELPSMGDGADSPAVGTPSRAGTLQSSATRSRTVLYVEDNASNVRLVERLLTRRPNVTLVVAGLGRRAMTMAVEHRPDLILLDLHLPDMSGEDVLRELRADPRTSAIPVVVLSADATSERHDQLLAQGARDFLTKPFDLPGLLAIIDEVGVVGADEADDVDDQPQRNATPAHAPAAAAPAVATPSEDALPTFAHDLNTLLGIIISYATLVSRELTDAAALADLTEIRTAATRAADLTRRFASRTSR